MYSQFMMHGQKNIKLRPTTCCRAKAEKTTYSVCRHLSSTKRACVLLYCRLWPVRIYHIFRNYLISDTIFGKRLLNMKYLFGFLYNFLETFLIIGRVPQDIIKNVYWSSGKISLLL